ncbi:MAG: FAD-dependent oxidoreductase [Dehalococcoidales bacterium]|jgi:electron transfer flavoprotein-quinone oxidoreductase
MDNENSENKFDTIIVGAGPAGTTAALVLAKAGLNVLLLERSSSPGSKNVFGGILYTTVLNRLVPNFWEEAPVERHIKGIKIYLVSPQNAVSIGVESEEHNQPPYNNSFTVSRAAFDKWYASKAEEAGAMLLLNTQVDDLLRVNGKVAGVKVRGEEGELYADTVILADGVNSILAEKAGLRKSYVPRQVSLGMKEIIELPRNVIEDRFGISGDEGVEIKYMAGDATKGIWGGGNIYTNQESVSLVTWLALDPLIKSKRKSTELFEQFKAHPFVKNYIKGGKTVEYQAHLAPDGGYDDTPRYFTDGLVIAGDAARFLNASLHYEGTNFAMASGEAAAKAILHARGLNDYSAKSLAYYQKLLEKSFVMKDLKRYRKMNHFAEKNPEFFGPYFDVITQAAVDYFAVKETPKRSQEWQMIKDFRKNLGKATKSRFPLLGFCWRCLKGGLSFL